MTEEIDRSYESRRSAPGWMIAAVAVLGGVALVGLVVAHNASTQAQEIQQSFDTKVKGLQADFASQVATLQQHQAQADTANSGLQTDLSVVTKRIRITQADLQKPHVEAAANKTASKTKIRQ